MVTAGDQSSTRGGAKRGRVKLRVAQSCLCDTVQGRGRDYPAEGARHTVARVVGHDQEHVGRTLGRYDRRRPKWFRIYGGILYHAAELRIRRRKLLSVDCRGRTG